MNCKFTNVLMFAAGAAIGSAVTWKVLKTKYDQLIQEEVESVKEAFSNMTDTRGDGDEEPETEDGEEDTEQPHQINWDELEDLDEDDTDEDELKKYEDLTSIYSNEKGGVKKMVKEPYVISPYDFGENDDFSQISLAYYSDNVLAYEDHEIITNVDALIGAGSLNTFGGYEDDSVFVRNEELRIDFEILKDPRPYEEATGRSPDQVVAE